MKSLRRSTCIVFACIVALSMLVGCPQKSKKDSGNDGDKTQPDKSASTKSSLTKNGNKKPSTKRKFKLKPVTPPKTVRLDDITVQGLKDFIAKKTGERRAVVVDYWAMWCAPCKKAFPHTVALSNKHAKDGLVVVSMNQDVREKKDAAKKFLDDQKALIYNFFPSDKIDPDDLFKVFGTEDGLPLYRVYGSDGKLAAEISGGGDTKAKLDAAVRKVLGYE